jgi:hypothetical protein
VNGESLVTGDLVMGERSVIGQPAIRGVRERITNSSPIAHRPSPTNHDSRLTIRQ